MKEIPGKSVLILGYGREGQSAHRYLRARLPEATIDIADQNPVVAEMDFETRVHTGKEYLERVFGYSVIVRSPGIRPDLPQLEEAHTKGKWITSATNIFFSECPGTIIGITGTKGKSTTTSLITEIVQRNFQDVRLVGNIGRPVLDHLEGANKKTIFVAELSSHQLCDIRYSPHLAVVLNIVPEHLDYYRDFDQYVEAKSQIVRHQMSRDYVIFNPSHEIVARFTEQARSKKRRYSRNPGDNLFCWIENGSICTRSDSSISKQVMPIGEIPLLGKGNLENTLAAVCVGLIMDVPVENIRRVVQEFKPLVHRLEFVEEVRGVKFYNDSLATIPEATINALEALGQDVITLIAGGFDRGLDYTRLGEFIAKQTSLKNLILFPDTGDKIWEATLKACEKGKMLNISKYNVETMNKAVEIAFEVTSPGKICLMSPASASFNLFKDYQERGGAFKNLVQSQKLKD